MVFYDILHFIVSEKLRFLGVTIFMPSFQLSRKHEILKLKDVIYTMVYQLLILLFPKRWNRGL